VEKMDFSLYSISQLLLKKNCDIFLSFGMTDAGSHRPKTIKGILSLNTGSSTRGRELYGRRG